MPLTAKDSGGGTDWEPVPAGVYQAVCYAIVDLGTQFNQMYGKEQHQVWIAWELPTCRIDIEGESKPRIISNFYTLSLGEKSNLRKHLESWRGVQFTEQELQGFDITKVFGANCQINVIHKFKKNGSKIGVIGSIMPLGPGMKKVESEAEFVYFSLEEHGLNIPEEVSDGIKAIIWRSKEWNETGQQNDEWRQQQAPAELQDSDPWGNSPPPPSDDDLAF